MGSNIVSICMSYGWFLDYLEVDRVISVDFYDNGCIVIVEVVDLELDNWV